MPWVETIKADEMRPRRGNYIETEARPRHNHEAEARPRRCIKTSRRGRGSTFAALRLPQGETSASRHTSLESNKRLAHLQKFITLECPQSSHSRLKKHCTTRCVEKQTAVFVFKLFPAVVVTLDDMTSWSGQVIQQGRPQRFSEHWITISFWQWMFCMQCLLLRNLFQSNFKASRRTFIPHLIMPITRWFTVGDHSSERPNTDLHNPYPRWLIILTFILSWAHLPNNQR